MPYDGIGYIGDNVDPTAYLYFKGSAAGQSSFLSQDALAFFSSINTLGDAYELDPNYNFSNFSILQQFAASVKTMPATLDEFIKDLTIFAIMKKNISADALSGFPVPGQGIIPGLPIQVGVILMDSSNGVITNFNNIKDSFTADLSFYTNQITNINQNLLSSFKDIIGINTENWNVFVNNNQVALSPGATLDSYALDLMKAAYTKFVSSVSASTTDLFSKLFNFKIGNYITVDAYPTYPRSSYQNFYTAFFGNTTGFDDFFAKFVKETYGDPDAGVTGTSSSFLPTSSFDEWTTSVMKAYYANSSLTTIYSKSSAYGDGEKTFTLNRIIKLLIGMTESLQKVAAAQSNRLGVYAAWQNAYTDLQNEIKYAASDDVRFNSNFTGNTDKRGDYNSANSSFTEIIKARKSTVGDDAKNFQTQVSQSSDAVNQQTNMATSIMQEMSTLLAAIYR